ncbi:MAG TPA: ATPase, T2SS/T4P/T4SS family, partial [Agromyces sp.]
MSIPFVATPSWERASTSAPSRSAARVESTRRADVPEAREVAESLERLEHDLLSRAADDSVADLAVLGPLAPFAASGPVTDLFVNGAKGLWVDRGAGPEREAAWMAGEAEVRALAVHLIARGGRHIDEATPTVDVRLGRGIRIHAVLPPISTVGTLLSVRVPRAAGFPLAALARAGMLDPPQESMLRDAVAMRRNLLVTGAGGAGKTTLLAALLGEASERERIVLIEDVAELTIAHPHVVSLEARQANLEGTGRVGLDALLREALR